MLVATYGIGATGGHFDPTSGFRDMLFGHEPDFSQGIADGPDAIRKAVRFEVKNGADVIKAAVSGGVLSLADEVDTPQLTPAEMAALVDESHRLRKKVAVHCHGDQAAKEAVEAGVDSIEHGSFMKPKTLTLMKNKGTYLTPTLMATEWIMSKIDNYPPALQAKAKAAAAARSDMFRNAVKMGIKVSFGTDAAVFPHGQNAKEFKVMVDLGMQPIDALKTATGNAADLFGIAQKTGTLEKAKFADVIAMPGDPTADITATVGQRSATSTIGCVSPVTDSIRREPVLGEHFALAFERDTAVDDYPRADIINKCRLNMIFASEAVRVKCDLVIQAAPLA